MDDVSQSTDQRFWARARRHMLGYGGEFVPFVPVRAEGAFLYDARAAGCWISPPAR